MKKIIILIFSFSILTFASEFKGNLDSQYGGALKYYKEGNFQSSYEILSKLYLTKLSDAELNFYLGRSAYETGYYDVALAAFERVEILDPSNLRNRLEMARTYFMLEMYVNSEIAFKEVLDNPNIPQNVRTNIELYLSKVRKVQQKSFTYVNIGLDYLYDSNVNYGSIDDEFNTNIGMLPSEAQEADSAVQVDVNIVNIYDIGVQNDFAIKNIVKLYMKDYQEFSAYNIEYGAYTPSILFKEINYLAELVAGVDLLRLDSKKYLMTFFLTPRFEYSHTAILKSIIHFKYQKKDFAQTLQEDLNANHYELAYSLQKILSPRSYFQTNIMGIQEIKEDGERVDVDYSEYSLSMAYANQFTAVFGSEFFVEYKRRKYEDYNLLFESTRVDDGATVVGSFNMKFFNYLHFHLKGIYNRVDSNQEKFSYQKYSVTTGMNIAF